jgi:hypothetical protein
VKVDIASIVVLAFLPLVVRTGLYLAACRLRSIHITLTSCILVAGAPSLIGFISLPIPLFVSKLAGIFLAMFLLTRYTEADLFPDVVAIPLVVELLSGLLLDLLIIPALIS